MSEPKPKKMGLFSKIESQDDALKIVKDASSGFFFVAILQTAVAYWVGASLLYDAALYVVGAFFLRRFKSRVAAVGLLVLALGEFVVTVANRVGANLSGGNNILLAGIVLCVAVRAVEATFKLRGRFAQGSPRGGSSSISGSTA